MVAPTRAFVIKYKKLMSNVVGVDVPGDPKNRAVYKLDNGFASTAFLTCSLAT